MSANAKITLLVKGLGHVPSKKNMRMAVENSAKPGLRIISRPEIKQWCEHLTQNFVSQLLSFTQTTGFETIPGHTKLSSIVSCLPLDDSRQWIPESVLTTLEVTKGDEGAIVTIEILFGFNQFTGLATQKTEANFKLAFLPNLAFSQIRFRSGNAGSCDK